MLRRPKRSKIEVVVPKEEEEEDQYLQSQPTQNLQILLHGN